MSGRSTAFGTLAEKARRLGTAGSRLPEAVKVNSQILGIAPDNLSALTRRGLCYLNLGKYSATREDLSRALRLYP